MSPHGVNDALGRHERLAGGTLGSRPVGGTSLKRRHSSDESLRAFPSLVRERLAAQ
jgi:hypothetical protein